MGQTPNGATLASDRQTNTKAGYVIRITKRHLCQPVRLDSPTLRVNRQIHRLDRYIN